MLWILLTAAACWLAQVLGQRFANVHPCVAPFWPASGVALAAVLLGRGRAWIGVAAGSLAANATQPMPIATAVAMAATAAAEAVLAACIVRAIEASRRVYGPFARPTGFLAAAAAAPIVSSLCVVATLVVTDSLQPAVTAEAGLTVWTGGVLGILTLAPLLHAGAEAWHARSRPSAGSLAKACGTALVGALLCRQSISDGPGSVWQFFALPVLLLAAVWFGRGGALIASTLVITHAMLATTEVSTHNADLLLLAVFLASVAITGLYLGDLLRASASRLPAVLLLSGWVLGGCLFAALQYRSHVLDRLRLEKTVADAETAIEQRLRTYSDALRSGASLFLASENVARRDWRAFIESLDMVDRYPGANGIGVIWPVHARDLPDLVERVRADEQPDFAIHAVPGGDLPPAEPGEAEHFVITLIEPLATNREALGLDVGSESTRRGAARACRDSGQPTITDRIELVQDQQKRTAFLLYVPMYQKGTDPQTVAERRRDFAAWIYAPFLTERFLRGVLGSLGREVGLDFYRSLSTDPADLLFRSRADAPGSGSYEILTHLDLGGQSFTLGWTRSRGFVATSRTPAMFAGACLALVSLLLAGFVLNLQTVNQRANAIVVARTLDLEAANHKLGRQIAERERAEAEAQSAREAAEAASRAKSEFLATMSHEIRTPMNSVIGFTDLLLRSPLDDEQRTWATYIQTSGRTLLSLINDILDFSKVEAGKLQVEHIPFSPLLATQEVMGLLMPKAEEKHLDLVLDVESTPPRPVLGDPGRFIQVLLNLVSNALKFTPHGEVRIRLVFEPRGDDQGTLRVVVSDTGIGIAADKLGGLFREFSQADSSTTRKYGGTGLGLAISRRLVELMGGSIAVASEVGEGSTFRVQIPIELAPADARFDEAPALGLRPYRDDGADDGVAPAGPARVLLAEDVAMNQALVVALLKRRGCEVDVAANGREAVELSGERPYDLILMDCQMPEVDGFLATAAIRQREAAGRRIPIVALTANALDGDRERCLAAGMDDYLTKPIRPGDLDRTLVKWTSMPDEARART